MSMANGLVPWTTPAKEIGGASGIIVDNNSTAGAASSIYFTTEQNPLNAVKLTQQGLN
jgi:hypothetical protein